MAGAVVFEFRAVLAPGCPERGLAAARSTNPPGAPLGVSPARRGILPRLSPGLDHRAGTADRRALEGGHPATPAATGVAAGSVLFAIQDPAFFETRLATGAPLDGGIAAAPGTKPGERAGLSPLAAAPAPLPAPGIHWFATVLETGSPGAAVSLALGLPAFLPAGAAQSPVRLVVIEAALGAQATREAFLGTLPGALVLGLAGFGIARAFDARGPAFGGAGAGGDPSFPAAFRAQLPTLLGRFATALQTQSERPAPGRSTAGALAVFPASGSRISVRHSERLLHGRMNEDGGPAGAEARPGGDRRSASSPALTPYAAGGETPVLNA